MEAAGAVVVTAEVVAGTIAAVVAVGAADVVAAAPNKDDPPAVEAAGFLPVAPKRPPEAGVEVDAGPAVVVALPNRLGVEAAVAAAVVAGAVVVAGPPNRPPDGALLVVAAVVEAAGCEPNRLDPEVCCFAPNMLAVPEEAVVLAGAAGVEEAVVPPKRPPEVAGLLSAGGAPAGVVDASWPNKGFAGVAAPDAAAPNREGVVPDPV